MSEQHLSVVGEFFGSAGDNAENPVIPMPSSVGGQTVRHSRSVDMIESLRLLLETQLGSTNFALYNVDEAKGVLWPMFHSSGEPILCPVDLMCNHSLRRAVESKLIVTFRLPLQLESFLPPVSAFIPLAAKGRSSRLLVLFDRSSDGGDEQLLEIIREHASQLLIEFSA